MAMLALTLTIPDWILDKSFWSGFAIGGVAVFVTMVCIIAYAIKDFKIF